MDEHAFYASKLINNYKFISATYKSFNEEVKKNRIIPPSVEWLLDNFYIIEEQVQDIRLNLSKNTSEDKSYSLPHVIKIASKIINKSNGLLDEKTILAYLEEYQTHTVLLDSEIWGLSVIIKYVIIENIKEICKNMRSIELQWDKAEGISAQIAILIESRDERSLSKCVRDIYKFVNKVLSKDKLYIQPNLIDINLNNSQRLNLSFIEHLVFNLRKEGKNYPRILRLIDTELANSDISVEAAIKIDHDCHAQLTLFIGNFVTSLKYLSNLDWVNIYRSTSHLEKILKEDPSGTYLLMDMQSQDVYRNKVHDLSSKYNVPGLYVANHALKLAKVEFDKNESDSQQESLEIFHKRSSHIGYYLFDEGKEKLKQILSDESGKKLNKTVFSGLLMLNPKYYYFFPIVLFSFLICALISYITFLNASTQKAFYASLVFIITAIPVSEIVICIANSIVCTVKKPCSFCRLELKDGIPQELCTVVVIPALLTSVTRALEVLKKLELHYLATKEENVYYALAGDFKDSVIQSNDADIEIINMCMEIVKKLNAKYSKNGVDIFFYFHRERRYNGIQKKWMGWERKRGALIEFNQLILGKSDTSFCYFSSKILACSKVKYIITLDVDTILPIQMARKMIGTIAHPLNNPIIDKAKSIVVKGYGIIQPRIIFNVEEANKSLFSRIFTGQEGIDPYSSAISDVYQDLFCEGIFTGKGIYDLHTFNTVLENAIPDNKVLSHDLLEGSYLRAGLASDLDLIDSYPTKYNSYISRLFRWVRGDWQLILWLGSYIQNRLNQKIKNPLSLLSKWKIIDNFRRSLIFPLNLILIILGFSVFPLNALAWLILSIISLTMPLIISIAIFLKSKRISKYSIKPYIPTISGLKASLYQHVLALVNLPYQSVLTVYAIIVTLIRVFITNKDMLEWVTSADAEKCNNDSLYGYYIKMSSEIWISVALVSLSYFFKPDAFLYSVIIGFLWMTAPFISYYISIGNEDSRINLSFENNFKLREYSRKTWRYFEEFLNAKTNYLPPDNYQESPSKGLALRTSPTNIGLGLLAVLSARDFGYIGITEMIDIISNIVSTIDQLEMWNGHLYNWYNIRTLKPLKPRYISTVDSGNLVCYYITLIQGLNENLNKPIYLDSMIQGLIDTRNLSINDSNSNNSKANIFEYFLNEMDMNVVSWNKALNQFISLSNAEASKNKNVWMSKLNKMIGSFKKEISHLMPWTEVIREPPKEIFADSDLTEHIKAICFFLTENIAIKNLPQKYKTALNKIDVIIDATKRNYIGGVGHSPTERGSLGEAPKLPEALLPHRHRRWRCNSAEKLRVALRVEKKCSFVYRITRKFYF